MKRYLISTSKKSFYVCICDGHVWVERYNILEKFLRRV